MEDEVLPGKIANVIALAINHIKDDDSEGCYTQEQLVSVLREQVSALQDESAQDSAVWSEVKLFLCIVFTVIMQTRLKPNLHNRQFVIIMLY